MQNLILLGAPGSGKGTQSSLLIKEGFEHISTGNLLRSEVAKGTELGKKVKSVLEAGQLVSDDLVAELLKANLDLDSKSYIFDGYPRNEDQAKTLDLILGESKFLAIYFDLDTEKLVSRLANRRVTKDGKNIYNLVTKAPRIAGKCDITGEDLIQRDDDKESVVRDRMDVFHKTVDPIIDYYTAKGSLVRVNADNEVENVFNEIKSKI